jgi:hypothetical protein
MTKLYTEILDLQVDRFDGDSDIIELKLSRKFNESPFTWSLPNETIVLELQYNKRFDYWDLNVFTENLIPLLLGRRLMPNAAIPIPFIKGQIFYYSGNIEHRDISNDTIGWYGALVYISDKVG